MTKSGLSDDFFLKKIAFSQTDHEEGDLIQLIQIFFVYKTLTKSRAIGMLHSQSFSTSFVRVFVENQSDDNNAEKHQN